MKIGTCVHLNDINEMSKKLDELLANGFDSCQLISWKPEVWTDENAEIMNRLIKEKGVTVSAFWCGWEGPCIWNFYDGQITLGLVPPEYRAARIKNLCDGADFAKKLGVTDVVTHMGFIPENPNDPQFAPFCVCGKAGGGAFKSRTVSTFCLKPVRKRPSPCFAALKRWERIISALISTPQTLFFTAEQTRLTHLMFSENMSVIFMQRTENIHKRSRPRRRDPHRRRQSRFQPSV